MALSINLGFFGSYFKGTFSTTLSIESTCPPRARGLIGVQSTVGKRYRRDDSRGLILLLLLAVAVIRDNWTEGGERRFKVWTLWTKRLHITLNVLDTSRWPVISCDRNAVAMQKQSKLDLLFFLLNSNTSLLSVNVNVPMNWIIYQRSNYVLCSAFISFIRAFRVSFFFFFFLIDNWPRVSRSHFHALTALSFDLFYNMLSRSRTRKKRRRGAAYGRNLYKINNDTSTKSIERVVVLVIVIIVIVVRSRRILSW